MNYPFTLWIPVFLSTGVQGVLWFSDRFFISWMDRTAVLWTSIAGAAAATVFLVVYRFFATDMKPWSLSLILASLWQFACIASSGYFVWLTLLSL